MPVEREMRMADKYPHLQRVGNGLEVLDISEESLT